jgi:hypothetical protein
MVEALKLITEAMKLMKPVDVADMWLKEAVTPDVFGPERVRELEKMRQLGLVKEYEGTGGTIIETYVPTGEWKELSNDGKTVIAEFTGQAEGSMTNRLTRQLAIPSYDFTVKVTLRRDESGIWVVDVPSSESPGTAPTKQP